jgi:hypothetical protein
VFFIGHAARSPRKLSAGVESPCRCRHRTTRSCRRRTRRAPGSKPPIRLGPSRRPFPARHDRRLDARRPARNCRRIEGRSRTVVHRRRAPKTLPFMPAAQGASTGVAGPARDGIRDRRPQRCEESYSSCVQRRAAAPAVVEDRDVVSGLPPLQSGETAKRLNPRLARQSSLACGPTAGGVLMMKHATMAPAGRIISTRPKRQAGAQRHWRRSRRHSSEIGGRTRRDSTSGASSPFAPHLPHTPPPPPLPPPSHPPLPLPPYATNTPPPPHPHPTTTPPLHPPPPTPFPPPPPPPALPPAPPRAPPHTPRPVLRPRRQTCRSPHRRASSPDSSCPRD